MFSVCGHGDEMMQMFSLKMCADCDASDEQLEPSLSQATTLHLASESEMEDELASESETEDEQGQGQRLRHGHPLEISHPHQSALALAVSRAPQNDGYPH